MTLNCKIGNSGIRGFTQAIIACCRLGDEVHFDARERQFTVKVMNGAKSALMAVAFDDQFFDSYDIVGSAQCALKKRSCLLAFKKEAYLTKHLDYLSIHMDDTADHVRLLFSYKEKYIKEIRIPIPDHCEILEFDEINSQQGLNQLSCKTRLFLDVMNEFSKEDELVTLKVDSQTFTLKTHFDDGDKRDKMTKQTLKADDFDNYDLSEEITLTFSLRFVKPFINYAMNRLAETIDMFLGEPGSPFFFRSEEAPNVKFSIALATSEGNEQDLGPSHSTRSDNLTPYATSTPLNTPDATNPSVFAPEVQLTELSAATQATSSQQNNSQPNVSSQRSVNAQSPRIISSQPRNNDQDGDDMDAGDALDSYMAPDRESEFLNDSQSLDHHSGNSGKFSVESTNPGGRASQQTASTRTQQTCTQDTFYDIVDETMDDIEASDDEILCSGSDPSISDLSN